MVGGRPVNGEVFYHEVEGMPFRMESFDGKIEVDDQNGNRQVWAALEALREYERGHGIKWEKL